MMKAANKLDTKVDHLTYGSHNMSKSDDGRQSSANRGESHYCDVKRAVAVLRFK